MGDEVKKVPGKTISTDPRFNNPNYEYIPPVLSVDESGALNVTPSGFVPKSKDIVDGKITITYGIGDEWVTRKQAEQMIAESENRILDIIRKSYGQYFL